VSGGFRCETERDGDAVVLRFHGDLDHDAAERARGAVDEALAAAPARVVIDVGALRFMDSTGIWLLVDTQRRALEAGAAMRLAGARGGGVARALELSGVDELIASQDAGPPPAERVLLRLYVSGGTAGAGSAVEAVRAVVARLPAAALEVIDVLEQPERAEADRVIATPTLVRAEPGPPLRLIGQLPEPDVVARHLGLVAA
jgi:circadian clock protein KaiB